MGRFSVGYWVVIKEPGDLEGLTGRIIEYASSGKWFVRLDDEMENDRTGEVVTEIKIDSLWLERLAEVR